MARYALNLPAQLKHEAEAWATTQGISLNQFILWAVAEKVRTLKQQLDDPTFPHLTYLSARSQWGRCRSATRDRSSGADRGGGGPDVGPRPHGDRRRRGPWHHHASIKGLEPNLGQPQGLPLPLRLVVYL